MDSACSDAACPSWGWRCFLTAFGAFAAVAQALYLRETLVVYYGNELTFGLVLASWLAGVFGGATLGGAIADRLRRPLAGLAAVLAGMTVILPAGLWFIRSVRLLWGLESGTLPSLGQIAIASLVLVSPLSVGVGAAFPLACRALGRISPVYVWEAVGSVAGGLAFSFLLVERLSAAAMAGLGAAVLMAGLGAALGRRPAAGISLLGAAGFLLAVGLGWADRFDRLSVLRRWQGFVSIELADSLDSRYQNLAVGREGEQYTLYANGRPTATWPNPFADRLAAMMLYAQHPRARRVLLLGGGYEGLAAELLRYPLERLDLVSLDPLEATAIDRWRDAASRRALDSPRFHRHAVDGRRFVLEGGVPGVRYDVVYIRMGDPATAMVNRYYTVEFLEYLQALLADDGSVALTVTGVPNFVGQEPVQYVACLYRTLACVFARVLAIPGTETWLVASADGRSVSVDPEVLGQRYRASGVEPAGYAALYSQTLIPADATAACNALLAGWRDGPVNRDDRPVAYWRFLRMDDRFRGGGLSAWFDLGQGLAGAPIGWALAGLAVLTAGLGWRPRKSLARQSRWAAGWAILTTGLTGMALELVLIFAYQNRCGYVYRDIGLLVALFMVGLAAGARQADAWSRRLPAGRPDGTASRRRRLAGLLAVQAGLGLWCVLAPWLVAAAASGWPIVLAILISGAFTGAAFPLAAAVHATGAAGTGATAGAIDAADHGGAALGALAVGTLLIPLLGWTWTCWALAGLVLTSVIWLSGLVREA